MCRNIRTLFNFEPPATEDEIRASALQFVRKLSGFAKPSQANAAAFDRAVDEVADAARRLLGALETIKPGEKSRGRGSQGARALARAVCLMTARSPPTTSANFSTLEPNATCGFVKLTFVSPQIARRRRAAGAVRADARPVGSALYFMVTPEAPVRLHRIKNDQLYHYYLGDPLELFLLHADGHERTHRRRAGYRRRPARAVSDPRRYLSHRAAARPKAWSGGT